MKCFVHQYYKQRNPCWWRGEKKLKWQTLNIWQRRKVDIHFKWTNDGQTDGSTPQAEMSPIKGEQDEARFLFYLETWRSGTSFLKEPIVDAFDESFGKI